MEFTSCEITGFSDNKRSIVNLKLYRNKCTISVQIFKDLVTVRSLSVSTNDPRCIIQSRRKLRWFYRDLYMQVSMETSVRDVNLLLVIEFGGTSSPINQIRRFVRIMYRYKSNINLVLACQTYSGCLIHKNVILFIYFFIKAFTEITFQIAYCSIVDERPKRYRANYKQCRVKAEVPKDSFEQFRH